jgi:hypothetical protein
MHFRPIREAAYLYHGLDEMGAALGGTATPYPLSQKDQNNPHNTQPK